MKKALIIIFIIFNANIGNSQLFKKEKDNRINLRGPAKPVDIKFGHYKSYSLKLNLDPNLEKSMNLMKAAYSTDYMNRLFVISGLKKVDDGEFKVKYNLTRFELVNDEYVEKTFQKAPAYYIGMESNLEILDKDGNLIYKRYYTPKVKMYVINPDGTYENLAYRVLYTNFYNLIEEFQSFYLYGPAIDNLRYFEIEKKKKSKSQFNSDEFNQSVQVLPTLVDVDRENWAELFGEAQKYWKDFINYEDKKDDDLQEDIRFSANYNLAATYILLGQTDEASKYLSGIKENEKSFMGMRDHYPYMKKLIEDISNYNKSIDKATTLQPIAEEPILPNYKKDPNAFHYAEFEGEVLDTDQKLYKGKIRIISDSPEMVDYRTVNTVSALRAVLSAVGADNSSVRIFIDGQKKPEKTNLKKVINIKDKEGRVYVTGKTGNNFSLSDDINLRRFALFEEIKKGNRLSLYHEFFPQDVFVLKKTVEDDFYSPPIILGRKKSLKAYFADCPSMIINIDKGLYDFENKESYLKMFDDYSKFCGNK